MGRFPAQGIATPGPRAYSWSIRIRRVALSLNFMLIRKLSLTMPARPDTNAKLSRKAITTVILHGSLFDEACSFGAPAREETQPKSHSLQIRRAPAEFHPPSLDILPKEAK